MTVYLVDKTGGRGLAEKQANVATQVSPAPETSVASASPKVEPTLVTKVAARSKVASSASVRLVPFTTPMIVGPDGKLLAPSAAVAVVQQPIVQPQSELENSVAQYEVLFVSARRVNVRGGPSIDNSVVGSVAFAEAVQVLSDPTEPWVQIRIEGDGVEGFMASRFLTINDPQG